MVCNATYTITAADIDSYQVRLGTVLIAHKPMARDDLHR